MAHTSVIPFHSGIAGAAKRRLSQQRLIHKYGSTPEREELLEEDARYLLSEGIDLAALDRKAAELFEPWTPRIP